MSVVTKFVIAIVVFDYAASGLTAIEKQEEQAEHRRSVMRSAAEVEGHLTHTQVEALRVPEQLNAMRSQEFPGQVGPNGAPLVNGQPQPYAPVVGAQGTPPPVGLAPAGNATNATAAAAASANVVEVDQKASRALATMLLAFVTFMVTMFYAVNYHDNDVRYSVWLTMHYSLSLLCGVLLFHAFKDTMIIQFGEGDNNVKHVQPTLKSLIIAFARLLVAFWMSGLALLRYRTSEMKLHAWGTVLGNVIAFAAIDSLGMIQQVAPFADNPANAFLGVLIASFMMFCMSISGHIVRQYWMTWETGSIEEHEAKWDRACENTEDHFGGVSVGYLLSIVLRYAITGEMPPIWGSPKDKTEAEVEQLFGVSLGLAFPVFFTSLATSALSKQPEGQQQATGMKWIVRCMKVFQTTLAMCMGWSLVYASRWQWWTARGGQGDMMTARLSLALIFSYVGFILIIVIDRIADKVKVGREGFRVVCEAFGLGIGMSWEGAFDKAVDLFAEEYGGDTIHSRAWTEIWLALFLIALMLPAWVWYILPKVLAGPEGPPAKKPQAGEQQAAGEQAAPPVQAAATGEAVGQVGQVEPVVKPETAPAITGDASAAPASAAPAGAAPAGAAPAGGSSGSPAGGENPGNWDTAQEQAWTEGGGQQAWAEGGGQGDAGWDESAWNNNGGGWGDAGGNGGAGGARTNSSWGAGGKGRGIEGKGGRGAKGTVEEDLSTSF